MVRPDETVWKGRGKKKLKSLAIDRKEWRIIEEPKPLSHTWKDIKDKKEQEEGIKTIKSFEI